MFRKKQSKPEVQQARAKLSLTYGQAAVLAQAVSAAADLYARQVVEGVAFAHWKLDFELWRDRTWGFVGDSLGCVIVNLYKPIGQVDVPNSDYDTIWTPYCPEHRVLLAILQAYLERIRFIVEKYSEV